MTACSMETAAAERTDEHGLTIGTTLVGMFVVNIALALTYLRGALGADAAVLLGALINGLSDVHVLLRLWRLAV